MIDNVIEKNIGQRQSGFTLVELMVAMTLSVVLMAGVINIYISTKQTYNVQEGISRLQENARFAMDRINKEIAAAGYLGCLQSSGDDAVVNTLADQTGINNLASPVFGAEGGGNPDSITVSRARGSAAIPVVQPMDNGLDNVTLDADHAEYGNLDQFDTIVVGDCAQAAVFMITNVPGGDGVIQHATGVSDGDGQSNASQDLEWAFGGTENSLATMMRVTGNTYSIATSAAGNAAGGACSGATPGFCALMENGQELVEGVENLQILYGVDTGVDTEADIYQAADAVGDWNDVVSVRVTLTMNEVERVQGSGNGITDQQKSYTNTIRIRSRGV